MIEKLLDNYFTKKVIKKIEAYLMLDYVEIKTEKVAGIVYVYARPYYYNVYTKIVDFKASDSCEILYEKDWFGDVRHDVIRHKEKDDWNKLTSDQWYTRGI